MYMYMYYNIITYNLKSGHLVLYVFSQLGVANNITTWSSSTMLWINDYI